MVLSIEGAVSDHQRSYRSTVAVADFFLKDFLGCDLKEAPERATKRFFESTEYFINAHVSEPSEQTRCLLSTITTLMNQDVVVRPQDFARSIFTPQLQDAYLDYLRADNVPTIEFDKSIELIRSRLDLTRFDFASGIAVIAPVGTIDHELRLQEMTDGSTTVRIQDQLRTRTGRTQWTL